jgi:tetratricopeptide (TPR) repeat protein
MKAWKKIIFYIVLVCNASVAFAQGGSTSPEKDKGTADPKAADPKVAASPGLPNVQKAEALIKVRNYQGALLEYENAIKADPNNHQFWLFKGNVYTIIKDTKNAIKCFERVVEIKKDFVKAHLALNTLYQQEKKLDKAIAALDNAYQFEKETKNKIQLKSEIIKLYYKDNKFEKAGSHIKDLKGLASQNPNVLFFDAKYSNLVGEYDNAIQSSMEALAMVTTDDPTKLAKYYFELGYAYHKKGDFVKADEALSKANYGGFKSKIFKLSPAYYYSLALAYYKVYEIEKSEEHLATALKIKKDYANAHDLMIKISSTKIDMSPKIESLKTSIGSEKDVEKKVNKLEDLAQHQVEAGKYAEAIATVKQAVELVPNNPPLLFLKSVAERKMGKLKEAATTLEDLINRPGISQEVKAQLNFTLGLIYDKMGNQDKLAEAALKKAAFGGFKYAAMDKLHEEDSDEESGGGSDSGE